MSISDPCSPSEMTGVCRVGGFEGESGDKRGGEGERHVPDDLWRQLLPGSVG